MDNQLLQAVTDEIAPILRGKIIGKIFQTAPHQLTIDFRADGRYLFLNFEPAQTPRLYLVRRRVKDLEKQSLHPSNFVEFVRKRLSNAQVQKIEKDFDDRIVRFYFLVENERGDVEKFALVAQLTGRAANFYLLDAENGILESLREGQPSGEIYAPPVLEEIGRQGDRETGSFLAEILEIELPPSDYEFAQPAPLSERLDFHFSARENERDFQTLAQNAAGRIKKDLVKKQNLRQKLNNDLTRHGTAEDNKRFGDLLLANAATARRENDLIFVIDYFDETTPEIAVTAAANLTIHEAAEKYFAKYAKARNAAHELTARIANLENEIEKLQAAQSEFEKIAVSNDAETLREWLEKNDLIESKPKFADKPKSKKEIEPISGTRRYRSSDGLEILVGRNSKDNDFLTMRVAKSLDWWLHAADYSGSHVVVRNPSKGELPSKTLLEAAQLAAKFSQAGKDSKVAVNYTQRKFVNKPKNAAPGLVRLASFRTILVEPKESGERILS